MKGSQDGAGRGGEWRGRGPGLGRGEGGVAEARVMAAPPNGRVGGGASAPARTGGRVRSPAPASRPAAASGLSRPAPSSSPTVRPPASGRQTLAKRRT